MSSHQLVDRRRFVKVAGGAVTATSLNRPESVLGPGRLAEASLRHHLVRL
jgi:hypothetical protein